MLVLNFYAFLFSSISFLLYCTKVLICNRLEVKNNNNSVTGPSYEHVEIGGSGLPSSLEQRQVSLTGILSKLSCYFMG